MLSVRTSSTPWQHEYREERDSRSVDPGRLRLRVEREIEERNERAQRHFGKAESELIEHEDETPRARLPDQKPKLSCVPPTQLGMRVMNPDLDKADAKVDIVAVHGLGAIPDITWKDSASGVDWLSDSRMLRSLAPEARILRFGYDSLWLGKEPIRTRLPTIADKLLLVLARERQDDPRRPLVFIGHCFGGLVIQRALITAKLYPETETEEGILKSAVGAVFLGTPNRGTTAFGSQSALLAAIAAQSELYPAMEAGVLEAMELEGAAGILGVSNDFLMLSAHMKLRITCFFEQRESNLGKMVGRSNIKEFVVNEFSAKLEGHRAIGLPLDHFKLNKFTSPEDGNYKDVAGEVVRFYKLALDSAKAKPGSRRDSSGDIEAYRRLVAKQELRLEEAAKEAALKEEDFEKRYQERLQFHEEQSVKDEAARRAEMAEDNLDRLKKNMVRCGLGDRAIRKIFRRFPPPLPLEAHYPEELLREQNEWYRITLKGALLEAGLREREADAVIHDTNDTMLIDGVHTSITRMLKSCLSERTLKRYRLPYMRDPEQPSIFIIKRWVPLYEKCFLWDHTNELRHPRKNADSFRPRGQTHWLEHNEPPPRSRNRDRSSESAHDGDATFRRRRDSTDSILSTPTSGSRAHRRMSSRTLQEQNVRRSNSQSSARSQAGGDSGAGYRSDDSEEVRERTKPFKFSNVNDIFDEFMRSGEVP